MEDDKVYCLYNNEHGFHSYEEIGISRKQYEVTTENQRRSYIRYIGNTYGDYKIIEIEYDWGERTQVADVECIICGEKSKKRDASHFIRGSGSSTRCHCRKDKKKAEETAKKEEREAERKRRKEEYEKEVGETYGKYEVIGCTGRGKESCKVRCLLCGRERRTCIETLRNREYPVCACESKRNYRDKKYIGVRFGHLVTEEYDGTYFKCLCDCGAERYVQAYRLFTLRKYVNCGRSDCKYISDSKAKAIDAKERGENYEYIMEALLKSNGYKTTKVGKTGDYGVDIIATDEAGKRIAIQCKCNAKGSTVGVKAIQEVYAGGRYYGLEHFAVVSYSGFSVQAIKMAKRLGVYLSDGMGFNYPEDIKEYATELIPTYNRRENVKAQKLYEINGQRKTLPNIAYENKVSLWKLKNIIKEGLTIENAIEKAKKSRQEKYTVNGVTGTVRELCEYFNVVSTECARYRIQHGMSIDEAVLHEKKQSGRPKVYEEHHKQIAMDTLV